MSKNISALNSLLLVVLLIITSTQLFFTLQSNTQSPKQAFLEIEYNKVGGKENYEVITELQKEWLKNPQNGSNIEAQKQLLAQLKSGKPLQNAETTQTEVQTDVLTQEQMDSILQNAVLEGNKEASVVVIEYADFECPFCLRQHNDFKILKNLKEEFSDKIVTAFKNHRGADHDGTEMKGLAVLCAEKLGGDEAYIKFYKEIFAGSTSTSYYSLKKLPEFAKEIGLDVEKWQSCVDNKETLARFEAETAEAKKYGMSGTPGTLIFNRNTGKYATVKGSYGYETFQSAVKTLLAE